MAVLEHMRALKAMREHEGFVVEQRLCRAVGNHAAPVKNYGAWAQFDHEL